MKRLRRLSVAVTLLLCFATPMASAVHGGQPARPGTPAGIAAPAPDGSPDDDGIPLCC
ncbi:hypothetical protein GCM10010335_02440 [Streptomyces galbus]|nr:hypothetical protein GCM10010335_02440 [Streptomyces galbus]